MGGGEGGLGRDGGLASCSCGGVSGNGSPNGPLPHPRDSAAPCGSRSVRQTKVSAFIFEQERLFQVELLQL